MTAVSAGMFMAAGGAGSVAVNSASFTAASGHRLYRTMGAPTINLKWTVSAFVKRSAAGASRSFMGAIGSFGFYIYFETDNTLKHDYAGTNYYKTTDTFTNTSGFDHIVIQFDSANATQADRFIVWKNGVRCSTSNATLASSQASPINSSGVVSNLGYLGAASYSDARDYFDGLIAEFYLIDGQIVAPTAFASGGLPIAYAGSYGANGVYMKYQNSGAMGTDSSTNATAWTNSGVTQSSTVP